MRRAAKGPQRELKPKREKLTQEQKTERLLDQLKIIASKIHKMEFDQLPRLKAKKARLELKLKKRENTKIEELKKEIAVQLRTLDNPERLKELVSQLQGELSGDEQGE